MVQGDALQMSRLVPFYRATINAVRKRFGAGASKPQARKAPEPVIHDRRDPGRHAEHVRRVRLQQAAGLENRWWTEEIAARRPRVDTTDQDTLKRLAAEFAARAAERAAGMPAPAPATAAAPRKKSPPPRWKPVDRKAERVSLLKRRVAILKAMRRGVRLSRLGKISTPAEGVYMPPPKLSVEERNYLKLGAQP